MLNTSIKFVLIYFDACSFNSGLTKLSRSRKAVGIINTLHILMAIFAFLYQFRWILKDMLSVQLIEVVNYVIYYSAALYTYWLIIMDSHLQKREHRYFWEIIQQIDRIYFPQNQFKLKYYSLKFFVCFTSSAVVVSIFIAAENMSDNEALFVFMFLIKMCEARAFYYMFCLEVLQFQLKTIKNVLINRKTDVRRCKWIRGYYHCI